MEGFNLKPYISYVLGSDDVEIAKPDPYPVLKTLADLNVGAEDAVVIGDMSYDILMGRRAGCDTCGVTYGNGTLEELKTAGATFVTDNLCKLGTSRLAELVPSDTRS